MCDARCATRGVRYAVCDARCAARGVRREVALSATILCSLYSFRLTSNFIFITISSTDKQVTTRGLSTRKTSKTSLQYVCNLIQRHKHNNSNNYYNYTYLMFSSQFITLMCRQNNKQEKRCSCTHAMYIQGNNVGPVVCVVCCRQVTHI